MVNRHVCEWQQVAANLYALELAQTGREKRDNLLDYVLGEASWAASC